MTFVSLQSMVGTRCRRAGCRQALPSFRVQSGPVITMKCSEMKLGAIYSCSYCGLEIEVKTECSCSDDDCRCGGFKCCGEELTKK